MSVAVLMKLKCTDIDNVQQMKHVTKNFEHFFLLCTYIGSLDTLNGEGLQNKTFVDIIVYLCNSSSNTYY